MSIRVKDYVDINDHVSLDDLIDRLIALRESLPDDPRPSYACGATRFSAGGCRSPFTVR
ncbi:MAG: hypothetical protein ABIQ32_12385 [Sphingomicrobium sp.]